MANKERVQLLVDALLSGEFKQSIHTLHSDDGFCCLGVACEVYKRETGQGRWNKSNEFVCDSTDSEASVLPTCVKEWFGFESESPLLADEESAIYHNDELQESFPVIATSFKAKYINEEANT